MFKKDGQKDVPAISSSSLSDIVFMLLFFFMVTTQLRETENKVMVNIPQASEVTKLVRKDLNSYINIGTPIKSLQSQYGTEARIQLNDSFRTTAEIRDFVAAERDSKSEADQDVRMGIVTDVKQELRRCSALRIMYSARKPSE